MVPSPSASALSDQSDPSQISVNPLSTGGAGVGNTSRYTESGFMGQEPTAPLTTYQPDSFGWALFIVNAWALEANPSGPLHDQAVPSEPLPSSIHASPWQI